MIETPVCPTYGHERGKVPRVQSTVLVKLMNRMAMIDPPRTWYVSVEHSAGWPTPCMCTKPFHLG